MTKRKKRWEWQQDFNHVQVAVDGLGGELVRADDDYVAFRFIRGNERLVFYPYKCPSATGHVLRIRFEGGATRGALQILTNEINDRLRARPVEGYMPSYFGYHQRNK